MGKLPDSGLPRVFLMDLWSTVPYYTAYLARALQRAGVQVQVGAITYYLDPQCFRGRGVRLDPGCLDIAGRLRLPKLLRRVLKLAEGTLNMAALVVRFLISPPEVVHVQFLPLLRSRMPLDLWFVRFCAWRGARTVLTVHDLLPHDTGTAHLALYRSLYGSMDRLICHSPHVRARLEQEMGIAPEKVAVIPHGPFFYDMPFGNAADVRRSLNVLPGQRMVLWQGILFPYKGVDLLLEAWQQVEQRAEDLCLVVLGTGDPALLEALRSQAEQLGLTRVRFHFRFCTVEELVAAYRAADAVVYPYRAITTSGALATGLALGVPIVASDLPVFREVLRDGENALLVDPTDAGALASALCRLASDDCLREKLREQVRSMQFGEESWRAIAQATLATYRAIASPF